MLETEEEAQSKRVGLAVGQLDTNQEWKSFVRHRIQPIVELERGKLCPDQDNTNGEGDSDGNIFDDDFIRSGFADNGGDGSQSDSSL